MRRSREHYLSGCCLAALAFMAGPGLAEVAATGSMTVSMVINANCEIGEIGTLAFGQAGTDSDQARQSASFEVRCTANTPFKLSLATGTQGESRRLLTGVRSGALIPYELFRDPALTQPWGNGQTAQITATGTGANQAFSIYGRVPDLSSLTPDSYTDNVTLSVSY